MDCVSFTFAPNVAGANEAARTIEEWAAFPGNWGSSGATSDKKPIYYTNKAGKWKKVRGNKWKSAMAMSYEQVLEILKATDDRHVVQVAKAIQKLETGKVRAVVNSDLETFLRMAYVHTWLDVAMKRHPKTSLFYTVEQMVEMWEEIGRDCDDPDKIKIPIDQSHFDWQQNLKMIVAWCDITKEFIIENAIGNARKDLIEMMDKIKTNLTNPRNRVLVDKMLMEIWSGLLSGWRSTAYMGTSMNYAEFFCALRLLWDQGLRRKFVLRIIAQGDDDEVVTDSAGSAAAVVEAYSTMNFEVNPSKFFVDNNRDEYLRQVGLKDRVNGYLVRAVNSLLWRNPIATDPPKGILRAKEQLKQWNLVLGRDADVDVAVRYMLRDISQGNGWSKEVTIALLHTPCTVGGLGLYSPDISRDWYTFIPGQVDQKTKVRLSDIRGLDMELDAWRKRNVTITKQEAVDFLIPNLKMPEADREITEGKIVRVEKISSVIHGSISFQRGYKGRFRKPIFARGLPPTLAELVLHKKIDEKDWDYINDELLDISCRQFSVSLKRRAGNTVWVHWLLDKLPWHPPVVFGWSDLKPTYIYNNLVDQLWDRVMHFNRINYLTIRKVALTAELHTRRIVRESHIRLGG